jgi:hypothetical protein
MPVAALAVHQLRYLLADGSGSGPELARTGHSYLSSLTPWLVLAVAIWLGALVGRLARAWRFAETDSGPPAGRRVWLAASLALVAIYAGQELLEGLLATGHPAGLSGVFGGGGWWALPAAVLVGGVLTLLVRSGSAAVAFVARRRGRPRPARSRRGQQALRPAPVFVTPASPLAACAPGRAPPLAC